MNDDFVLYAMTLTWTTWMIPLAILAAGRLRLIEIRKAVRRTMRAVAGVQAATSLGFLVVSLGYVREYGLQARPGWSLDPGATHAVSTVVAGIFYVVWLAMLSLSLFMPPAPK